MVSISSSKPDIEPAVNGESAEYDCEIVFNRNFKIHFQVLIVCFSDVTFVYLFIICVSLGEAAALLTVYKVRLRKESKPKSLNSFHT